MPTPTAFFRWWIFDERTGKRRLTTYKLKRADAERQFPAAEPGLQSRRGSQATSSPASPAATERLPEVPESRLHQV